MVYLVTAQVNMFKDMGTDVAFATVEDLKRYFKDHIEIDFDTETEGFDPYTCNLISSQFGDAENQFLVDHSGISIKEFKDLLEKKGVCINMQNAKFDLRFLYHQRVIPSEIYDTYLAEKVLTTGNKKARAALDYLVYKYCKQTMDKTVRGSIHREGLSKRVILYAAKDVAYLGEIKRKQLVELERKELLKAIQLDNLYVLVLAYIEYSGFKLDVNKWKDKMKMDQELLHEYKHKLNKWVIDNNLTKYIENQLDLFSNAIVCNINWSSSQQVVDLFRSLGIDTKVKDSKTGKYKDSVDAKVVTPQKDKSTIIPTYLNYKASEKVVSTYGNTFLKAINPISRRIHTSFTQIMDTGRLSCGGKNKATGEEYLNLQNIPTTPEEKDKEEGVIYERECFVTGPGYKFIVADYSGQEQVVLANQSLDKDILEFYDKKLGDMHAFNASKIWPEIGNDLNNIKKEHKEKRQLAKLGGFAINYGGNGNTVSQNLNIPLEQGEAFYNAYLEAFPGLVAYWEENKREALKNGYILFNHVTKRKSFIDFFDEFKELEKKIKIKGFWTNYKEHKDNNSSYFIEYLSPLVKKYFQYKGTIERKALNYPVQGTSADITKLAGVYIFDYLKQRNLLFKVWMPNVIHDEILLEAPESLTENLSKIVKDCMEKAGERFYKRVPLHADPIISNSWTH